MMHWQETARVLHSLGKLTEAGRRAVLATVVRIHGSVYRRPGAKLLVADDGVMDGSVSGGCLEADVREHALNVMRTGIARLLHYDTGTDDTTPFGLGLGCNGAVDVFVQPADTLQFRAAAARMVTLLQGDGGQWQARRHHGRRGSRSSDCRSRGPSPNDWRLRALRPGASSGFH